MTHPTSGVIYEPHDPRVERYPADVLIGAPRDSGPMADHVHCPDGWPNQQWTEECCGAAIRQAVWIRQCMMGVPPEQRIAPSDTDIYYRARASRHGWKNIVDIGSNPVAAWEVLRPPGTDDGLGVVRYEDLPFDPFKIDNPPDPAVYKKATKRTWLEYRWILDDSKRCEQLDALLKSGHPVTGAITCDQHIASWRPSDGAWRFTGTKKGGHYLCFVHVDENGNYVAVGTWGPNYGESGFHRIARSEVASSRTSYLATPVIDMSKVKR